MIVTTRNTQEMILSWEKSFGTPFPEKQISGYEVGLALAASDPNIEMTTVSFDDLVSTPETVFADLAAEGWPIDPIIAASTINPDLKRF
jgi:pyruvate/2-oxoglutarate/acetoin dehydrogenase E1 component